MNEQGTLEWKKERLGRVTASRFGNVMVGPKSSAYHSYARQLRSEFELLERINAGEEVELGPDFYAAATAWGKKHEPIARAEYEFRNDCDVEVPKLIVHPQYGFAGASLDGIHTELNRDVTSIFTGGHPLELRIGLEAKCPYNPEVHARTLLHGVEDEHRPQVQGEIWVAELDAVDFVSFNPRANGASRYFERRIYRDDAYIKLLSHRVIEFWAFVQSGEETPAPVEVGTVPMLF